MTLLAGQLEALVTMNSAQLRREWLRVWKEPSPPLGHDLLRRGVAWKLQASAYGGMAKPVERELDRLARQVARGGDISFEQTAKTGTRLVREWGGRTHHVMVQDDGYMYEGERYTSLSQIACLITGTKWSGPRFFGLTKRPKDLTAPPVELVCG
jgi:hypothetical protein